MGEILGWPTPPRFRWQIRQKFGNPGDKHQDMVWKARNIVSLKGLPNLPSHRWVDINRQLKDALTEALRRAELASPYRPQRCGGYNWRTVRHKPGRLSLHAWGIAVDIDPEKNSAAAWKGKPPEPWSEGWMKQWPHGVDEAFVKAFESVGWRWGGRWQSFVDPMHFEWRRR